MNQAYSEAIAEALAEARREWPWSACPPEDYDRFVAEQIEPILRERIESAVILYAERETPKFKIELSESDQWLVRNLEAKAWEQGEAAGLNNYEQPEDGEFIDNPYRTEDTA